DLAHALALREDVEEVIVIPRVMRSAARDIPAKVTFVADAARGPLHYARALARAKRARFDLVICGHINLLAAACMLDPRPLLMIYGIEAWKRPRRPGTDAFLRRCRALVSISA